MEITSTAITAIISDLFPAWWKFSAPATLGVVLLCELMLQQAF